MGPTSRYPWRHHLGDKMTPYGLKSISETPGPLRNQERANLIGPFATLVHPSANADGSGARLFNKEATMNAGLQELMLTTCSRCHLQCERGTLSSACCQTKPASF